MSDKLSSDKSESSNSSSSPRGPEEEEEEEDSSAATNTSSISEDVSDCSEDQFFDAVDNAGSTLTRNLAEEMEQILKYQTPRPTLSMIKGKRPRSPLPTSSTHKSSSSSGTDIPGSPGILSPPPDSPRLGLSPLSDKGLRKEAINEEALQDEQNRRRRMEDMRRRLNTDEVFEEPGGVTPGGAFPFGLQTGEETSKENPNSTNPPSNYSPGSSRNSSVEGFYGGVIPAKSSSSGTSHPFKVVDHDSISLQSGISVTRPLVRNASAPSYPSNLTAGSAGVSGSASTASSSNGNHNKDAPSPTNSGKGLKLDSGEPNHGKIEPDLVASCKSTAIAPKQHDPSTSISGPTFVFTPPVAPPRKNRGKTINLPLREDPEAETLKKNSSTLPKASNLHEKEKPLKSPPPNIPASSTMSSNGSNPPTSTPPQCQGQSNAVRPGSESSQHFLQSPAPSSPTVSIRSFARDLDRALDQVINTQKSSVFVVKAQDEERTRARNSGPRTLRRTESLPKDVMDAVDPISTSLSGGSGSGSLSFHSKSESNSNSSTLGEGAVANPHKGVYNQGSRGSLGQLIDSGSGSRSSSHRNQHISSVISAIASMEESQEAENNSSFGESPPTPVVSSGGGVMGGSGFVIGIGGSGNLTQSQMKDAQMNMYLRTKTDSGKLLSDLEILEQVTVLNLDTGERIALSNAEDKLPKCINPLSLHIMRLTSEYVSEDGKSRGAERDSDEESMTSSKISSIPSNEDDGESVGSKRKTAAHIKRFLGSTVRRTVGKAKQLASQYRGNKEDVEIGTNEGVPVHGQETVIKIKASHSHKGPYDFDHLQEIQDLTVENGESGPVWCMKFSNCGRLLATAGQDKCIRIWVLKDHLAFFQDIRSKHSGDKVSPTPSQESVHSRQSSTAEEMFAASEKSDARSPFVPKPFCIYSGHQADLLDMAWSKSFFLLSSSMDRTVRLWHISRRECLCCFQHIDFVTAIAFHPRDDRYFLSGSLDGKLRLWNIPDKKVALWNEVNGANKLITAANFCQNGKFAVIGTYDGRCIFYHTEQLKYHTQIHVHSKKRLAGRKITGIEPMPGEDKLLVTSNDSRIRLYDLRDLSLTCKYKGYVNLSSQIKASFSQDGKYIISGSENHFIYIWKTIHDYSKFSSARRDRNGFWQGVKAHNALVTSAIFAPDPDLIVRQIDEREGSGTSNTTPETEQPSTQLSSKSGSIKSSGSGSSSKSQGQSPYSPLGYVLVSADFSGSIKIFLNRLKPKCSSLPASCLT